jgi:hypothetical protein
MSLSDLGKHLDQHHLEARIQWGCLYCEKNFPKLHGVKCHLPKCNGNSQNKEQPHKCEACPMSFGTQRGLSTHERHAHPALRSMKRRGTDPRKTKVWKEEEVALLKELEEVYKDHRFPNVEISKVLTNKTKEQIEYQRRKLKMASEDEDLQGATQETEGGCDPVTSGNSRLRDPECSGHNNDESTQQWRLAIAQAVDKPIEVPSVLREVNLRLEKVWNDHRGNEETLGIAINEFICRSLYGAIEKHLNM